MEPLGDDALAAVWIRFKTPRIVGPPTWVDYEQHLADRNALLVHYTPLVRRVASRLAAGLPSMVDRDDLASYGQFGLIQALNLFDPERGVDFELYAMTRIRFSMIDELRKLDWVPRAIHAKSREIDNLQDEMAKELGRHPEDAEVADRMDLSIEDYWHLLGQSSGRAIANIDEEGVSAAYSVPDAASNPEEILQANGYTDVVAHAVSTMPERDRTILALCYFEQMTLTQIGQILGVTESRVCQLQGKILQSLGEALRNGMAA